MTETVLLVDDNAVQREIRREILVRAGAAVAVAAGGREAMGMLENPGLRASLALLVTDHIMPGMGGPELASRVRAILPDLPVLVLSGLPGAEEEYAATPVFFRLKPCPPAELIRLAKHLLAGKSLRSA